MKKWQNGAGNAENRVEKQENGIFTFFALFFPTCRVAS
jgi:hypothetical protein